MIFALTENVELQLVVALIALISLVNTMFTGLMNYQIARLKQEQSVALATVADKAEEVKETLATDNAIRSHELTAVKRSMDLNTRSGIKAARIQSDHNNSIKEAIDENTNITSETYKKVNGALGEQMKSLMHALRLIAQLQPTPGNETAAAIAEKNYHDHEELPD